jgi:hypothetical protein
LLAEAKPPHCGAGSARAALSPACLPKKLAQLMDKPLE